MNYRTVTFYSFCLFSLTFAIACGAQNDSSSADAAFIQQLIDDPLTKEIQANHKQSTDLIMYNNLNIEALGEVLKNTPGNDPCKVKGNTSQIAHAEEYFDNMCRHMQLNLAINKKHPMLKNLDSDTRVKLFYNSEQLTEQDVRVILDSRSKID